MSLLFSALFFISLSFCPRCSPAADDANSVTPLSKNYNEQFARLRRPDNNKTIFFFGMQGIWNCAGQRIPEHGGSFFKSDAVLGKI